MRPIFRMSGITGLALAAAIAVPSPSPADEPARLPAPLPKAGMEVQSRGPIHQAFAQPGEINPRAGEEAPRQPPNPIPELPPDRKPEGANVKWIPGYWQWDGGRKDFLWVSGVYRNMPPDREWVAGYWTQAAAGNWRYVDGYWGQSGQAPADYVPEPPPSVENGPSSPSPDDGSVYTSGTWMRQDQRWLWRPGYYAAGRPGRMWIGPRYLWTPRGYVFVDGYWDYPLEDRGVLFAPVYFTQPLWQNPSWYYQPDYVVDCGPLFGGLFVGPWRHHYYFGDYYGPRYAGLGFRPWYGGRYFDPLFNYYSWRNRGNPGWYAGLQRGYAGRVAGTRSAFVTPLNQFRGRSVQGANFAGGRQLPAAVTSRQFKGTSGPAVHANVARNPAVAASRPAAVHMAHAGPAVHNHAVAHAPPVHHAGAAASYHHAAAAPAHHAAVGHGGGGGHGGGHGGGGHGGGHAGGGHGGGHGHH